MSRVGVANYFPANLKTVDKQNVYWKEVIAKAAEHSTNPDGGETARQRTRPPYGDVRSPLGEFYKPLVKKIASKYHGAAGKSQTNYGTNAMSAYHRYLIEH